MSNLDFVNAKYLQDIAAKVIAKAEQKGASAVEVNVSRSIGKSLSVRNGKLETVESLQDQGLSIIAYFGITKGIASCSDLSEKALDRAITKACDIAKFIEGDVNFGLADPSLLLKKHVDLALYYPADNLINTLEDMAIKCEQVACDYSDKIIKSEGANVDESSDVSVYANSNGFNDYTKSTRYSISCSVIAKDKNGMQRDYSYAVSRDMSKLTSAKIVGEEAAKATLSRLNVGSIKTGKYPIIFDSKVASSLFSSLLRGISGSSLYNKTTFLLDSMGQKIFPDFVNLYENPLALSGLSSSAYDGDGVKTSAKHIVKDGVVSSYLLGCYYARKLGLTTTANSGGVFNLEVSANFNTQEDLIKEMGTGILITDFMGSGTNLITGDYSRGASGFWVENGEIKYPVEEITIAGKLQEMYENIIGIAGDVDTRHNIKTGSILLAEMTVSSN